MKQLAKSKQKNKININNKINTDTQTINKDQKTDNLQENKETLTPDRNVRNLIKWRVPNEAPSTKLLPKISNNNVTTVPKSPRKLTTPVAIPTAKPRPKSGSFTSVIPSPSKHTKRTHVSSQLLAKKSEALSKSVSELFSLCEEDFSSESCKSAIQLLSTSQDLFKKLLEKIEQSQIKINQINGTSSKSEDDVPNQSFITDIKTIENISPLNTTKEVLNPSNDCESRPLTWSERLTANIVETPKIDIISQTPPKVNPPTKKASVKIIQKPTPEQVKVKLTQKITKAGQLRERIQTIKLEKLKAESGRVIMVTEKKKKQDELKKQESVEKQQRADQIHSEHINQIVKKAEDETNKVDEIQFITQNNALNKKYLTTIKLEESSDRRSELFEERKKKHEEERIKAEATHQRKKQIESDKLTRLQELELRQKKQEQLKKEHLNQIIEKAKPKKLDNRRVKRICKYCSVEIPSEDVITTHISGKKHKQSVEQAKKI